MDGYYWMRRQVLNLKTWLQLNGLDLAFEPGDNHLIWDWVVGFNVFGLIVYFAAWRIKSFKEAKSGAGDMP